MTAINWKSAQLDLARVGQQPGVADGVPGPKTYTALLSHVAGRSADATIRAIAGVMAVQMPLYGFDQSAERLAEFAAETANETGGYKVFQENMCYSAKRLMQVWPSRFPTLASAQPYAWDPSDPDREDIALANMVYGSRMGNEANGTDDNDGWDHRGGGMLQHTGAAEYARLLARLGFTPDDVRDPAKSVIAACDYMVRANTMDFVDRGDFRGARRSVNGGYIGVDEVATRRARALQVLL